MKVTTKTSVTMTFDLLTLKVSYFFTFHLCTMYKVCMQIEIFQAIF